MPVGSGWWIKKIMTNQEWFGQRIAAIWRDLIEHLEKLSREQSASSLQPHHTSGEKEPDNEIET